MTSSNQLIHSKKRSKSVIVFIVLVESMLPSKYGPIVIYKTSDTSTLVMINSENVHNSIESSWKASPIWNIERPDYFRKSYTRFFKSLSRIATLTLHNLLLHQEYTKKGIQYDFRMRNLSKIALGKRCTRKCEKKIRSWWRKFVTSTHFNYDIHTQNVNKCFI